VWTAAGLHGSPLPNKTKTTRPIKKSLRSAFDGHKKKLSGGVAMGMLEPGSGSGSQSGISLWQGVVSPAGAFPEVKRQPRHRTRAANTFPRLTFDGAKN